MNLRHIDYTWGLVRHKLTGLCEVEASHFQGVHIYGVGCLT